MGARSRRHLAVGVGALLCALAAHAHIVYGTRTLLGLTVESDLVLRGRIVAVEAGPAQTTAAAGDSPERTPAEEGGASPGGTSAAGRPAVEAEVLEVFKGAFAEPRIRFAQHGHGVARFEPGDETLLFLVDIERSRELDALGRTGAFSWVSLQEHEDEYVLVPATRKPLLAAIRTYATMGAPGQREPQQRVDALRGATLGLLTSGDSRLASSALRDLAMSPGLTLLEAEDLPSLDAVLSDPDTSMGVRVTLLHELERRRLVTGPERWLALLSAQEPTADRVAAIRGARSSTDQRVRARITELLSDPDDDVAAAAAIALGAPGNQAAVEPLGAVLATRSSKVRMAAIRGLGAISGPEARAVLESTAESHPDPATRRRARAELRKREGADAPS